MQQSAETGLKTSTAEIRALSSFFDAGTIAMSPDERLLYAYIFIFLSAGISAAVAPFIAARILRPARCPGTVTIQPYECGIATRGYAWDFRYGISYYLYALIFLAFEVDVLYLFPAVAAFDAVPGAQALLMLGLFLAVLSLGLIYAWKKGSFEWKTPESVSSSHMQQGPL